MVPPRVNRMLMVGALLATILLILSPTLLMLAWHLRHGNAIECTGKSIFVPFGWIAEIDSGNHASLTKIPLVIPMKSIAGIYTSISIGQSVGVKNKNIDDLYKSFQSWFWNLHSDLGEIVSGPVKLGSGPQEVFCMAGANPRTNRSSASCLLLGGNWTADFMGTTENIPEFFVIVQKIN
jgi:hypothetical protein